MSTAYPLGQKRERSLETSHARETHGEATDKCFFFLFYEAQLLQAAFLSATA